MQAAHRLLARVAAFGVRHAADLVEAYFLRDRLLVDFRSESRPARQDPRELEGIGIRRIRTGLHQARSNGLDVIHGRGHLKEERRHVIRPRHLDGPSMCRAFHDVIGGVRNGKAGRAHHRDGMRAGNPQHGRVLRAIRGAGEPRWHGALQDQQRAFAALGRNGVPHARSQARRPAVHDDHSFGREQRAIDERAVARLLEIVRQQALKAGDGALRRPGEIDDADVGARDDRAGPQAVDDLGGHGVLRQPRHRRGWSAGEDVAHKWASSVAL